jgi:hypothetical protein
MGLTRRSDPSCAALRETRSYCGLAGADGAAGEAGLAGAAGADGVVGVAGAVEPVLGDELCVWVPVLPVVLGSLLPPS